MSARLFYNIIDHFFVMFFFKNPDLSDKQRPHLDLFLITLISYFYNVKNFFYPLGTTHLWIVLLFLSNSNDNSAKSVPILLVTDFLVDSSNNFLADLISVYAFYL